MRTENVKLAVGFAILAAFFYAVLGALMKIVEQTGLPNETLVFFRQMIGLVSFVPILLYQHKPIKSFQTKALPLHLIRAFSSICAMYCLVFALKYLPLVDALLLTYTRPLFLPIIVLFWFRKKWSKRTFIGIVIGFLGVALILKPDKKLFDIAALVGLASALFGSISFTCVRKATRFDSTTTILLYYLALSIPLSIIPMIFHWTLPTAEDWIMLAIIGICGLLYQISLTKAYHYGKAFQVSSVLYSTAAFGAFFDFYLGDFSLDYLGFAGILCIVLGTLITVTQKHTPFPPENFPSKKKGP
ncbi:MAG: DMT family transporter, partial [Chlamydiae bacterium]|nr:DMT family transporter [Chlamydiota bacterium]